MIALVQLSHDRGELPVFTEALATVIPAHLRYFFVQVLFLILEILLLMKLDFVDDARH